MISRQSQKGGDGSTNIQAKDLKIVQGLTYTEVRQVAIDVFKSNFYELAGEAKAIASERAEQVTEAFLRKLQSENPDGFTKAQDPDFQHAIFTVQKEYARTGDKELGDLLVDLLVDRSKQDNRDILQIVLNESLIVAPKLTLDQINALSLIQILSNMRFGELNGFEELEKVYKKVIGLVGDLEGLSETNLLHLQYSGALSINHIVKKDISRKIYDTYKYISIESGYEDFISLINNNSPSLKSCISAFNKNRMYRAELTSVGAIIGLANLKKIFSDIDYSIWIK